MRNQLPYLSHPKGPVMTTAQFALTRDDLSAVRLLKVPESAPPFDGEMPTASHLAGANPPGESTPRRSAPEEATPGGSTPAGATPAAVANDGRRAAADDVAANAGPGDWPSQFARLLAEVLAGSRPLRQVFPWTTERARIRIRRLTPGFCAGQRPRVLRVLASQPANGIVEMSVILGLGARTKALAVRLENVVISDRPARWLCTDIEAA
jgi:hypothetical protein